MFQIRWKQSALNQLAALWMQASSVERQAITAATHAIEQRLRTDPQGLSESRRGGRRILFVAPLGILFRIDASRQVVFVLRVWLFRKKA